MKSGVVGLALLLCCLTGMSCGGHGGPASSAPEVSKSRIKLSITTIPLENPEDIVAIRVSLENSDRDDLMLNLGSVHSDGRCLHPDALKLFLTDGKGRSSELLFIKSPGHSDPAGRASPYLVPLRASSAYVLNLNLRQYAPAASELRFVAGKYRLRAEYDGTAPALPEADGASVWRGKLLSNELTFRIR